VRRVQSKVEAHRGLRAKPLTLQETASNPYRMVRLVKACCQGGNDEGIGLLTSSSEMLSVEACCRTLLAHIRKDSTVAEPQLAPAQKQKNHTFVTDGETILRTLSPPSRLTGIYTEMEVSSIEDTANLDVDDDLHKDSLFATKPRGFGASRTRTMGSSTFKIISKEKNESLSERRKNIVTATTSSSFLSEPDQAVRREITRSFSFVGNRKGYDEGGKNAPSSTERCDVMGATVLTATESYEDGCLREGGAFEVLSLLVELVDLLPLSSQQVRSPLLWECVGAVCVPAIDALARNRQERVSTHGYHTTSDRVVCAELVDLLDRLLLKVNHFGLMDDLLADQYRAGEPYVDDMRDDLQYLAVVNAGSLGRVLSKRSREAVDRIFVLCDDMGDSLPMSIYGRKDPHVYDTEQAAGFVEVVKMATERNKTAQSNKGLELTGKVEGKNLKGLVKSCRQFPTLATPKFDFFDSFQAFQEGILSNSHVNTAILRRRYELLTVLERGTTPDPAKYGTFAVAVTWEMLVARFIRYAKEEGRSGQGGDTHIRSSTCQIILRLLRDHLVKARTMPLDCDGNIVVEQCEPNATKESGGVEAFFPTTRRVYDDLRVVVLETVDVADLPLVRYRREFVHKQHVLLKHGCVDLTAHIMMTTATAANGDLADKALEVLDELIHGGDVKVRKCLYELLGREDTEDRFMAHLVGRLELSGKKWYSGKNFGLLGELGRNLTEGMQAAINDARKTIRFMSHLCAGHFTEFQSLLGDSMRAHDLVGKVIDLLCSMAETQQAVMNMSVEELSLIRESLEFLYQAQDGNPANQYKVAFSDVPMAINLIVAADSPIEALLSQRSGEGSGSARVGLHALCFRVLSSCLGNSHGSACHDRLRQLLEMNVLYEKARAIDTKCRIATARLILLRGVDTSKKATKQIYEDMDALAHLWKIHFELFPGASERTKRRRLMGRESDLLEILVQVFEEHGVHAGARAISKVSARKETVSESDVEEDSSDDGDDNKEFGGVCAETIVARKLVGTVEVSWEGRLSRVCFPIPHQSHMLTQKTKLAFLNKTRLFTMEKRLEIMFDSTDLFIAEMCWVQFFSEYSTLYRIIGQHLTTLQLGIYSLVVLLNVNVLMSPPALGKPLKAAWVDHSILEEPSLFFTFLLGALTLIGYFLIMCHELATSLPILICEIDRNIERDRRTKEFTEWKNMNAFRWWSFFLLFITIFITMHACQFPRRLSHSIAAYAFLIFGVFFPLTLSCLRNYIVVPTNRAQRLFMILYDSVTNGVVWRRHIRLMVLNVMGFFRSEFFTLMLMDVINLSPKLANVTGSIIRNAESLGLIFFLCLATTLAFAAFGIEHFPGDFTTTFNGTTKTFKSVLSAFWFLVYGLSSSGTLKGFLKDAEPKSADWLPRIAFDGVYYIWVGIILMTTITALIVDGLGTLRTDAAKRHAEEKNVCFMCGLKRDDYDDLGLSAGSPSFDDHIDKEHDPWVYVAFLTHLRRTHYLNRTALEAFVDNAISTGGTWVPVKSSFVLEAQGKTGAGKTQDTGRRGDRNDGGSGGGERLEKLEKAVNGILIKLDKAIENKSR